MRILITGAPGQVGFELMHALRQGHEVIGMGRDRMDLRDSQAVRRAIRGLRAASPAKCTRTRSTRAATTSL